MVKKDNRFLKGLVKCTENASHQSFCKSNKFNQNKYVVLEYYARGFRRLALDLNIHHE